MEKTTKKSRKKSKRLKKRIGIIAVGGLSFVLTICLSVGATLAWFAGSTWASKDVYMGGPVYVEMNGSDTDNPWKSGSGMLDIKADTSRTTGTVQTGYTNDVLLPGQKIQITSRARVYSTNETDSRADGAYDNLSSGANTSNTSTNSAKYNDMRGRITTTTSSVLRARFSINVEFDPSVGFNNFTDEDYMKGYPVQSEAYTGDRGTALGDSSLPWKDALTTTEEFKTEVVGLDTNGDETNVEEDIASYGFKHTGRRDYVKDTEGVWTAELEDGGLTTMPTDESDYSDMILIQKGDKKSIYKWRYCSKSEYLNEKTTIEYADYVTAANAEDDGASLANLLQTKIDEKLPKYIQMGFPFNGKDKSTNSNGYYGVWVLEDYKYTTTGTTPTTVETARFVESSGFYKARTNAYLQTYVEYYENEYGNRVERTIANSLTGLDNALNNYFKTLINDSSDTIISEIIGSTLVRDEDGYYQHDETTELTDDQKALECASWLYIDPKNVNGIDTNTDEISTSTGGWWYLVSCDYNTIANDNAINLIKDSVPEDEKNNSLNQTNTPKKPSEITPGAVDTFTRGTAGYSATDAERTYAKLYEIKPDNVGDNVGIKNGAYDIKKVASDIFPFVDGTFALPGDALTNVFANAKISFQISFQAIQAFFPYTNEIDGVSYQNNLFGTAKALNIKNAVPIFNEAFDYTETGDGANEDIAL